MQFTIDGKTHFAEVLFYFLFRTQASNELKPVAMVSLYGPHHEELWKASSHTYWTARHLRDNGILVIDVKNIDSVVMMAPDTRYGSRIQDGTELDRWYQMEKPGLKLSQKMGFEEVLAEDE